MTAPEDKMPLVDEGVRIPLDNDSNAGSKWRPTLLRRLKNGLKVTTMSLHAGYGVAVLLLSVGFGIFVVIDWVAQHFGIAIGEGLFIGAAFLRVTKSYISAQEKLKYARAALERVDEQVFEQVAYALRVFMERGLESIGLVVTVWVVPLAIKAPQMITLRLSADSVGGKLGAGGAVLVVLFAIAIGAKREHDKLKQMSSRRIDEIVDHVDEMREFDWLDVDGDGVPDVMRNDVEAEGEVKHE